MAADLADLRVDLDQVAVDRVAVTAADELDVAVRLVVAAADERRLVERGDVPVDEGPRPVVVDREEDDVSLADDATGRWPRRRTRGSPATAIPLDLATRARASALFVPRSAISQA